MRHLKAGRKLGRTSSHRLATLRNMVTSLLQHEKIETTDAKAKELRPLTEKMVTLGKRGDLHARRLAMRVIRDESVAKKLFDDIAPRFKDRAGGYTRILRLSASENRLGDNAPQVVMELLAETKKSEAAPAEKAAATAEKKV